jgi:hypothetical protein
MAQVIAAAAVRVIRTLHGFVRGSPRMRLLTALGVDAPRALIRTAHVVVLGDDQ